MNLIDIEKLGIKAALDSDDQMEYVFYSESPFDFVVKKTFLRSGYHFFHIPLDYPRGIPMWRYIGEDICAVTLVNFYPDTDSTLTRLFLRAVYTDYHNNKRPFPECFRALDPIYYLYIENQFNNAMPRKSDY
nr:hypothetical transcript [Hymenolepis microstoma]